MTCAADPGEIYQLHIWLREISPMIWRRLLVQSDSTIADLHYTLQIAFGWSDAHLHRFIIHGKAYGIAYAGGMSFADDPTHVPLRTFRFRTTERLLYEYDFGDLWQHTIRVERILPGNPVKTYPICISGARSAPPEDCGGPWAFMQLRQQYSPWFIGDRLVAMLDGEPQNIDQEELLTLRDWLNVKRFDQRAINRRLQAYARGDDRWIWA